MVVEVVKPRGSADILRDISMRLGPFRNIERVYQGGKQLEICVGLDRFRSIERGQKLWIFSKNTHPLVVCSMVWVTIYTSILV